MRIGIVVTVWNCQLPSFPYYIDNMFETFAHQDFDGQLDVLFVDNQSSDKFLIDLRDRCLAHTNDKVTFSYVSEKDYQYHFSSMNLGFYILNNHAHYDYFGYSADDVHFQDSIGLRKSLEEFSDPEVALVTSQCNYDNAPKELPHYNASGDRIKVKLGECANLHLMMFSREYMEAYNFRYPDVLQCWGTESLLTYFCAAIGKVWVVCPNSKLLNSKCEDKKLRKTKKKGLDGYVLGENKTFEELFSPGVSVGMGFQDFLAQRNRKSFCQAHDRSLYDGNDKCIKKDHLHSYIKSMFFVHNFDYKLRLENLNHSSLKGDLCE